MRPLVAPFGLVLSLCLLSCSRAYYELTSYAVSNGTAPSFSAPFPTGRGVGPRGSFSWLWSIPQRASTAGGPSGLSWVGTGLVSRALAVTSQMSCCEYQKGFVLLVLKPGLPPRTCTPRSLAGTLGRVPTHSHSFSSSVVTELGAREQTPSVPGWGSPVCLLQDASPSVLSHGLLRPHLSAVRGSPELLLPFLVLAAWCLVSELTTRLKHTVSSEGLIFSPSECKLNSCAVNIQVRSPEPTA